MPIYKTKRITRNSDVATSMYTIVSLERMLNIDARNIKLVDSPNITITYVFDDDDSPNVDFEERYDCIKIGKNTELDSSENPAFPNHPVKLTCVKTPNRNIGKIVIGENTYLGGTSICCYESVEIGNNVLIAPHCVILDCFGHSVERNESLTEIKDLEIKPVKIENNVWIGYNVTIMPGVTIGENSVIGACSVVTKSIPANVIAAGNPCKIIKNKG